MGMAASQARLLSITSRMSDNELRAQIINNNKMRLASESSQASERYITALNDAKYKFSNYDSENNISYTNLTFNNLTSYNAYNNQYALRNSGGKILISETDANNFEAVKGSTDPLTQFLKRYGIEKSTTYFDNLKTDDNGKVLYTTTLEDGSVKYVSSGFTANQLKAAYLGESVGSITSLSFIGKNGGVEVTKLGYDNVLNSTLMYEYVTNLSLYEDKAGDANKNALKAGYAAIDNTIKNTSDFGKSTYNDLYNSISTTAYNSGNVGSLIDNAVKLFGNLENISSDTGKKYCQDAKAQLNDIRNKDTITETVRVGVEKVDNNNNYETTESLSIINKKFFDVKFNSRETQKITLITTTKTAKLDDSGKAVKDENGGYIYESSQESEDLTYNSSKRCYEFSKVYTENDKVKKVNFTVVPTPDGVTYNVTKDVTPDDKANKVLNLLDGYRNNVSAYIASSELAKNSEEYASDQESLAESANALYQIIYGKSGNYQNSTDGPPPISLLGSLHVLYNNQGKDGFPNFQDDFYKVFMNVVLDNVMNTYGEPKIAWTDTKDPNNNGDAKAQWYTNLFNRINQCGYAVLKDGLASSEDWIKFAFESGLVTMEQVDSYNEWNQLNYNNCSDITEQTDDKAVTVAEAEYNAAMNKIENKDKKYDLELKNIDTEHNSLQTEYDSIKSAMDKNIERNFKLYG